MAENSLADGEKSRPSDSFPSDSFTVQPAAEDREDRIRRRAYDLWEQEGRPEGAHERHWHQAARDVDERPGVVAWTATYAPREERRIRFGYSISSPRDSTVYGMMR